MILGDLNCAPCSAPIRSAVRGQFGRVLCEPPRDACGAWYDVLRLGWDSTGRRGSGRGNAPGGRYYADGQHVRKAAEHGFPAAAEDWR